MNKGSEETDHAKHLKRKTVIGTTEPNMQFGNIQQIGK